MGILKNQLSGIEAGVWCADTDMGRLLAMELVPFLNFIILGGAQRISCSGCLTRS